MSLFAFTCHKQIHKWKYLYRGQMQLTYVVENQHTFNNRRSIKTNSSKHCIQIVKKYDFENYLTASFIKSNDLRRTTFALRAFNVELAQIRDLTKSDATAQIRFQFWSDIIDYIYANKSNLEKNEATSKRYKDFPVAAELQDILSACDLSKHWFRKMINIRREAVYLSDFPFKTMDELEKYWEASLCSLYYLLNEKIIEHSNEKSAGFRISLDHIGSHLGKAQGLTNTLRGVIHNAGHRRCYIPNDILVQTKCTHEDFLRGNNSNSVSDAIYEVASHANTHLDHCLELIRDLKQATRDDKRVYLSILPLKTYLNLLQKCDFRIFDPRLYQKKITFLYKIPLWWLSKSI